MNTIKSIKKKDCSGCHACFNICPVKAIYMRLDAEGFLYPEIDEIACIHCGKCLDVCPSVRHFHDYGIHKGYACYARDVKELMTSSSGGVFAVVARKVLDNHGMVYGASFDQQINVEHIGIRKEDDLSKLKGTKYLQSHIGSVYSEIKDHLTKEETVLFSGTPCQVAGLKSYLGKEYESLICIDLICHGVPSETVWQKYLIEKFGSHKVVSMCFRNKNKGLSQATVDYILDNGSLVKEAYSESPFMRGFIQNYYLRHSCFHCLYKGFNRCSDLTIGDYWGVKHFHPELNDQQGISAVITHSAKGEKLLQSLDDSLVIIDTKINHISCWNECLFKSVHDQKLRKVFYHRWHDQTVESLVNELYLKEIKKKRLAKTRLINICKKVVNRVKRVFD